MKEKVKIKSIAIILIFIIAFQYISILIPFGDVIAETTYKKYTDENGIKWSYVCNSSPLGAYASDLRIVNKEEVSGEVVIPQYVKDGIYSYEVRNLDSEALAKCEGLTKITIQKNIGYIADSAFSNCINLKEVIIQNGVNSIGRRVFEGCSSLESITIPSSVGYIGLGAFKNCTKLNNIILENNNYCIEDNILYNSSKTKIISCLDDQGYSSFTIPDSVNEIGASAFYGSENLKTIKIPNNVTKIGTQAFARCENIQTVKFIEGENKVVIESYAFERYSGNDNVHADVYIPDNVNSIGYRNFNMQYTIICNPNSDAEKYAKQNNIPYEFKDKLTATLGENTYEFNVVNGDIVNLKLKNSINEEKFLIPSKLNVNGREYVVKKLNNIFSNNAGVNIKEIEIPNTVVEIEENAFYDCQSLEKITVPESVTSIGEDIFYNKENVTIYCLQNSAIHRYAQENQIKTVLKVKINFKDQKLYNKIKTDVLGENVLEFNDKEKEMYVYKEDTDQITNLNISSLQIEDLTGIEQFSKLEILNASSNSLTNFSDNIIKINTLKELDLSNNNLNNITFNINNDISNLPNLENLNLSNTQISNIETIKNLPKLKNLNLDNNYIRDISEINEIRDRLTDLSIKNQKIEDEIIKKKKSTDEIPNIINYSTTNEYSNGQINYENCIKTDSGIEFNDDINDENKIAKLTINGGIMDGTEYTLKPSNNVNATVEINDDLMTVAVFNAKSGEILNDANILYSVDYNENIKYEDKIWIKEGNHTYHIKLFNKEIDLNINNTLQKGTNIDFNYNIRALEKENKIYILANTYNKKYYCFEENGEYKEYTGPIENVSSKNIYVKIGENNAKLISIENLTEAKEEDYTILDEKLDNDVISRYAERKDGKIIIKKEYDAYTQFSYDQEIWHDLEWNNEIAEVDDIGTNYIYINLYGKFGRNSEEFRTVSLEIIDNINDINQFTGITKENNSNYIFSSKYTEKEQENIGILAKTDEKELKKIDKNIISVTKFKGNILMLSSDGIIYKYTEDNFIAISNNTNFIQIDGPYLLDNENNIYKYDIKDGKVNCDICNQFNIESKIEKLKSVVYNDTILPYVLYENGFAVILKENGKNKIISNKATDISVKNESNCYYAMELDNVKENIPNDPMNRETLNYASNLVSIDEKMIKSKDDVFILTDKGNLYIHGNTWKTECVLYKSNVEYIEDNYFKTRDGKYYSYYCEDIREINNEIEEKQLVRKLDLKEVIKESEIPIKINKAGEILTNNGNIYEKINKYGLVFSKSNIKKLGNYSYETTDKELFYNNMPATLDTKDIIVEKDEANISQNDVKIKITFPDNKYTVKLPDGTELNSSTTYSVNKNGTYVFSFTNVDGLKAIRTVHVTNIQERKETKIPEVSVTNGKVKLLSDSKIQYQIADEKINENNIWLDYTEEITYEKPIYARVIDDKFYCSIIKITLDNGNLYIENNEQREIKGQILTNAIGNINYSEEEFYNYNSKALEITKEATKIVANTIETNKNPFKYISEIAQGLIYVSSSVDGKFAGCYFLTSETEITYKDINEDILTINEDTSIKQNEKNSNLNIDYAVIKNNYVSVDKNKISNTQNLTDEEIERIHNESLDSSDLIYIKTNRKDYAYIDNKGNLYGNIERINKFKEIMGESFKYVKILGDGQAYYILNEEGDVYLCDLYRKQESSKELESKSLKISKIKSNIIDIYDSGTALDKEGKIVSLLNNNEEDTVIQELEKQTDKYLISTHLGLKDGKLYDFTDVRDGKEVTKGKIKELLPEEKEKGIAVYSVKDDIIKYYNKEKNSVKFPELEEGECIITAEEIDEQLPEFVDIAEYREGTLYCLSSSRDEMKVEYSTADKYAKCIAITKQGQVYAYINGYAVDTGMNLDYFGPTVNYNIDNSNWTNKDINAKISPNTTNEIIYSKIEKEGNGTEEEGVLRVATANTKVLENEAVIKTNGKYNYFVMDKKNRTFSGTFDVNNIDKLKPITPIVEEIDNKLKVTFKDDMPATIDYAKSGIAKRLISYDKENWEEVNETEILLDKKEKTTLYAKTIDNAGNESDIASVEGNIINGKIIVLYNDIEGKAIKDNDVLEGKVGENYKTKRQAIEGYELVEIVGNEEGKYQIADQFIIYKYKKIEDPVQEPKEEPKEEHKEETKVETYQLPQTGQSRIIYIIIGTIILVAICGLIYIKYDDIKSNK